MITSCQHTKLRYDKGFWAELDPFYDFKKDDERFLGESKLQVENSNNEENASEDNDDGWEDMSEGDAGGSQDDDEEMYDIGGYEKEIARFGLDVTPLGELVFPDGRIVGHRALRRYYNQRLRPVASSDAVRAAKHAAGERLYEGQVVNVRNPLSREKSSRAGKGILVPLKDGAEGFSALSLYRYRAAIKKKHIDDDKGRRLKYRTSLNINRMDKKANRLMNGVSVAHAKR
jgi:pre-60S factor REI1